MRKKFITGAAVLALLMNAPQVSADDDIVIFGGEFEDTATPSAPKKVEKPAPKKDLPKPPVEKPKPTEPEVAEPQEEPSPKPELVEPQDKPPTQPLEERPEVVEPQDRPPTQPLEERPEVVEPQDKPPTQPLEERPEVVEPQDRPPTQPLEERPEVVEPQDRPPTQPLEERPEVVEPQPPTQPLEERPEVVEPQDRPPTQPIEERPEVVEPQPPTQPIADKPTEKPETPEQIERQMTEPLTHEEIDRPFERPSDISGRQEHTDEPVAVSPTTPAPIEERPARQSRYAAPQETLKTLKPRFLKLAVDDTYTYYLDKTSVQWKRVPYLANEYMADVWVRMIEREPKTLDDDMESYGAETFRAEVALAREQGYRYSPEDLKVLRNPAYVLEHYYLRPKTKQILFLCELEVFGRPQNAINERAYDYKNWENLVPGSIESVIYDTTIKIIGKSKASDRGHMTFFDMLDEYARIALN